MEEGELGGWEGSKGRPGSKERSGERMSSQRGKEWRGREEVGREEKRSQFKWEDSQACKSSCILEYLLILITKVNMSINFGLLEISLWSL